MRKMATPQALTTTAHAAARVVKALLAAAITVGVLGGIPWALLHYAGDPLPRALPHLDAIKHALTTAATPQVLLTCLSLLGWYLWLILAVSFAVELVAAARRIDAPHIPTLGPAQTLAAALIAAIGITALLRPAPAHAAETIAPSGARVTATAATTAPSLSAAHAALAGSPRERVHTVEPGESLYSIAEEDLGDGQDWPQLYKLNAGVVQADGEKLTNPDLIRPDWTIRIVPAAAGPAATPTGTATAPNAHTRTPTAPTTSAPGTVAPATRPGTARGPSARPAPAATHTASPTVPPSAAPSSSAHDQSERAQRRHGGVAVALPDGGTIGITLAVALGCALVLARRWRTRLTDPRLPEAEPPLPGALLAARRAQLALTATTDRDGQSETADEELDDDLFTLGEFEDGDHATPQSDQTPNGFEGDEALAAADDHRDEDVREHVLESDRADDTRSGDDELDEFGAPTGPVAAPTATHFTTPLPPGSISAAERDGTEIPLPSTGAGLGLVGPGAAGAARAIAASVLSAGAPDRTGDLARLIIPAADLAALLGVTPQQLPALTAGVPELVVTADLAAALSESEVNALLRTRLLEETGAADLDAMAKQHPEQEDCPPLVLMASPQRFAAGRISALIDDCARLRITTVLLGSHPRSATVFVEPDGRATGPGLAQWAGTRLFDLSADSLTAVLRLLAEAAGHQVEPPPAPAAELTAPGIEPERAATPQAAHRLVTAADPTDVRTDGLAPVAASTLNPAAHRGEQPISTPRLIRAADPGEQLAQAQLEAWASRPVRISVLGSLRIEAGGEPVTKLRSQARPIAALLAWKGGAGITDEQIDAACWPDEDDLERVRRWRQDGLKSLRSRLRESTGRKTSQFVPLRDRRDYLLDPEHTAVDLWLLRALENAASAARDEPAKVRWLEQAVPLCAGQFLIEETGYDFAWADAPRVTVKAEQVSVLTRYAELAAENEQPDAALAALRQAAALADDNEYIYRRMFELLAALGRRAEIAAQMEVLTVTADTMGATVHPATRELAARLLRPAASRTPPVQAADH